MENSLKAADESQNEGVISQMERNEARSRKKRETGCRTGKCDCCPKEEKEKIRVIQTEICDFFLSFILCLFSMI